MALFSKRNLDKAKALAEKNKEKIASGVNKATGTIDKKTGGKHTDKLKKVDDAAKKFAGQAEEVADDESKPAAAADESESGSGSGSESGSEPNGA